MTRFLFAICILILTQTAVSADITEDGDATFFELKIRPVLMNTCFKCHGGDKVSGKLRVDSREHLIKGGKNGAAIVIGNPERSALIRALSYGDEELQMPPKKQLPKQVVADFKKWIRQGAQWPKNLAIKGTQSAPHWSFQPIANEMPPTDSWSEHPIDRFIRAKQKSKGIDPVRAADKRALIRRATFDLVGLPPAPEHVKAFIQNDEPNAFARVVDRLLASPRYGERWGRHWLDLVRYADTAGENSDYPIPEAYLYRNYVINAFNSDKPYDQFIHEQVAGDILANSGPREKYAERVIATGFIAQSKRFGTHKLEDMHLIIEDTVHTMGQVVLGMTFRCARCHDHKYDPISCDDYYALYGFFQSTTYPFPGGEEVKQPSGFIPVASSKELASRDEAYRIKHEEEIKGIQANIQKVARESDQGKRVAQFNAEIGAANAAMKVKEADKSTLSQKLKSLKKQLVLAQKQLSDKTKLMRDKITLIESGKPSRQIQLAYAVREGKAIDAAIQLGGEPKRLGKKVRRGVPRFLEAKSNLDIPENSSGRLQLARWLTKSTNPLTARVMVNRIWQHHFGKALVATPSDFGTQGEFPTHPKLLDWLAAEFIRNKYSIKHMHRQIMLSKTYQLAAKANSTNDTLDAGNAMYWRFDRQRLDAEQIRDSMLLLGGNLDLNRPGPHPFPPKNKWKWTAHHQFKAVYPSNHRSVYLMVQRLHPHPYLSLFNSPDTSSSTAVRDTSTVALQSLFMLNSDFVHKQAQGLAAQLIKTTSDSRERIKRVFERVYARPPSKSESEALMTYHNRYRDALRTEKLNADKQALALWSSISRILLTSNEFIYVN